MQYMAEVQFERASPPLKALTSAFLGSKIDSLGLDLISARAICVSYITAKDPESSRVRGTGHDPIQAMLIVQRRCEAIVSYHAMEVFAERRS